MKCNVFIKAWDDYGNKHNYAIGLWDYLWNLHSQTLWIPFKSMNSVYIRKTENFHGNFSTKLIIAFFILSWTPIPKSFCHKTNKPWSLFKCSSTEHVIILNHENLDQGLVVRSLWQWGHLKNVCDNWWRLMSEETLFSLLQQLEQMGIYMYQKLNGKTPSPGTLENYYIISKRGKEHCVSFRKSLFRKFIDM